MWIKALMLELEDHVTMWLVSEASLWCHLESLFPWEKPEKQEVSPSEPQRDFESLKMWNLSEMQEAYLIQPSSPPYMYTSYTSFNGNETSFQILVNWTVSLQGSVLNLVLADREVRSPLSVSCQAWQMGTAGWHHGDLELGPWSLIPSCCGLCCGKDLSAFPVLWFLLLLCSVCTSLLLSALHCVWLTAFMEQTDMLASCGTPELCLSVTKYVVTIPPQHVIPGCLWRGLLAPLGITTERAAVCQPPPEPLNWVVVNLLLEEFPTQQTWLSLTFITWKPYHRWVRVSYNP